MDGGASKGILDPDRLFQLEPSVRGLARDPHAGVRDLPIISPHGHTDPRWFAEDTPFPGPAQLFESFEVGPGDAFVVPSGVTHGCKAPGRTGVLLDTFTPCRDDFL